MSQVTSIREQCSEEKTISEIARTVFPTDDSLFKILFLAMKDITAKWYGKPHNWGLIISQLMISVPDRISEEDFI